MPILGNRLLKRQSVSYLLRDDFTTTAGAPLASPRTAEPGPGTLTITDTSSLLSIASAKLTQSGTPATAWTDPRVVSSASFARVAGRALLAKINTDQATLLHWNTATTGALATIAAGLQWSNATTLNIQRLSLDNAAIGTVTSGTDYQVAVVLESTGAYLFIKGGSEYPDWTLLFSFAASTNTPLYPSLGYNNNGTRTYDYLRVTDLTGAFASALGIATLNQASPSSGSTYTGDADGIYHMTVTAPNPLLGTTAIGTEMRYRVQDANNYWTAYFREDGQLRVDSVSGGVATNRLAVGGLITNGATVVLCVITSGSKHNCYTFSGGGWLKRGSEINVSHLDTLTTMQPQIGTNWAASNLRSWARTSSLYNQLNSV